MWKLERLGCAASCLKLESQRVCHEVAIGRFVPTYSLVTAGSWNDWSGVKQLFL